MEKEKTIYELGLHEELVLPTLVIVRVSGGWIYRYRGAFIFVFVPMNEEFSPGFKVTVAG